MADSTKQRLVSLDVFRGMTIAGMVLVNNPGTSPVYWPLDHAEWNGLTPTDWIFPFFLFIVGVAAANTLPTGRVSAFVFAERYWYRDADDEQKERKDPVGRRQAVPLGVIERPIHW